MPISAKMGSVSEFLVVYLDSIDERLLDYLDEEDELRPEVVKRLRYYTSALLEGSITPAAVAEDWADWFDLTQAFVAAYAPEEVEELEEAAPLMSDEVEERHRAHRGGPRLPGRRRAAPRRLPRDAAGGVALLGGERLVHGVGEVGVGEVQVPGGRGDVGVAEEALDDVDVHAAAQEAGGVGVAPAVGEVAPETPAPVPAALTNTDTDIGP